MHRPSKLLRLFYINYVMARHGVDRVVLSAPVFSPLKFLSYLNPWNWGRPKHQTRGESVRLALQALGPIFVKFGQILSTRPDLLPDDIIQELEKLQDQVPPFSATLARKVLEQAYGRPLSEVFAEFSAEPFASASIAQVHKAVLPDGKKVVVKILRPGIEKIIRRDVGLMYTVARLTERFWSHGKRLRAVELVAEFERTILDELDFMREAANASQLRRNFQNSPLLYVPEIFWDYTLINVITMEHISGIPVSDKEALIAQGVDLKKLAERGVEVFFTQVFRDSFFHADMHPGNIFVAKEHPEDPQYIAIDFGIMGILSPKDQHYLAENLVAFFKRDYRQVAVLHVESGWVPPTTRVEEFEVAIRSVCEPVFEKPLRDISFGQLLLRLFQTASRFKMQVQPQLFLLQKTLLNIEGLGRKLYPQLDLWATAKPILERSVRKRYSAKQVLKNFYMQTPQLMENLVAIPQLCREILTHEKDQLTAQKWQERMQPVAKKSSGFKYFFVGAGLSVLAIAGGSYFAVSGLPHVWFEVTGVVGLVLLGLAWLPIKI